MMIFTPKKVLSRIAGMMSLVYFVTNCLLPNAAEANFWAERRKAVQGGQEKSAQPMQMAALPASALANPSQILNNLSGTETPRVSSSLAKHVQELLPADFEKEYGDILNALPYQYGQVRNVTLPVGKKSGQTIIHIQSVHMNLEAQQNIGRAVQELFDKEAVGLVGIEGSFGEIDLSRFRNVPDRENMDKVADYLLRENKITGPAHEGEVDAGRLPGFVQGTDTFHRVTFVDKLERPGVVGVQEGSQTLKSVSRTRAVPFRYALNVAGSFFRVA